MSFKGKTYSKKGSGGSKTGNPFERMMKEQCNKPVAAKSAGIVGKWGTATYTTVRGGAEQNPSGAPKVKKFFKSRTENVSSSEEGGGAVPVATVASARIITAGAETQRQNSSKKIFRSKNTAPVVDMAPAPARSSRSQRTGAGAAEAERSPLQDADWPPAPADPADSGEVKKLPVPRSRRARQQVPDETPLDKESRLFALFNSQSKENQPSEKPRTKSSRSAKTLISPPESHKRKAVETPETDPSLPPIKLKLSLNKNSDSDKYKVVKHSDVNNSSDSDLSNGWRTGKHVVSAPASENIIEQSDLELLEADFVSEPPERPRTRTRQRSPARDDPPRKLPRNLCDDARAGDTVTEDNSNNDMFEMLLNSRPKRGRKGADSASSKSVVPTPAPTSDDIFDQMLSVKDSSSSTSELSRKEPSKPSGRSRRYQKEETTSPTVDASPYSSISSIPDSKQQAEPPTYKKTFFKSRNKVQEEPKPPPPPIDTFSMEFDRVPPIPSVYEPTPPSSQSQPDNSQPVQKQPKSRNKFFKSKNKNPDLSQESKASSDLYPSSQSSVKSATSSSLTSPVSSQPSSLSRVSSFSPDISKKPAPPPLRSPSPDNIHFPTRIATPVKTAAKAAPGKKSIFKHKAKENKETKILPKKAMSLYKHRMGWGGDREELKVSEEQSRDEEEDRTGADEYDDFEFDSEPAAQPDPDISFAPSKLIRVATYPMSNTGFDPDTGDLVTQVKCPKSYKEHFTVIKNVKTGHEINELGEFQEFTDDVEYICDGMKPRNKLAARCLAAISLAQKCMKPNFRMHLRAHGEVSKFFGELKDAPSNSSLALCTSTILFVLSQDRLNMDMDRESLELMLNLLDTDSNINDALDNSGFDKRELEKNKQKVIDICTEMKSKGHAGTLNLDMISADHLAMETLLSMTSKRAGEWFKEELRELGGLAHLARTFTDCVSYLTIKEIRTWTEQLVEKLKKANRILRVLENVSHENEENCNYLIEYGRSVETQEQEFVETLQRLFKLLDAEVQLNPTTDTADKESVGVILRETLFSVMRVHINLVHDYRNKAYGSLEIGQQEGCVYRVLRCIFIMPYWFCPLSKRFEALVLSLTLLINMVEHSDENR